MATDWDPQPNSSVRTLAIGSDGALYAGGFFQGFDAAAQGGFAAFPALPPPPTNTLSVAKAGAGSGTVTSSPAGIDCGASCSQAFADGSQVTLTATPASGSTFVGFSGAGCVGTGPCTISLGSDATVIARFDSQPALTPPETMLETAKIIPDQGKATFRFAASGTSTGFDCALAKKHKSLRFRNCESPQTYKHLKQGPYTFAVRAVGPGGADPIPAKKRFRIKKG